MTKAENDNQNSCDLTIALEALCVACELKGMISVFPNLSDEGETTYTACEEVISELTHIVKADRSGPEVGHRVNGLLSGLKQQLKKWQGTPAYNPVALGAASA